MAVWGMTRRRMRSVKVAGASTSATMRPGTTFSDRTVAIFAAPTTAPVRR
jgi:hypothetical protein